MIATAGKLSGCIRGIRQAALACCLAVASFAAGHAQETKSIEEIRRQFQNPPDDARLMMRWWWFGPTVTKAEIGRELQEMKKAGIGGVELQSVYPLVLDDEKAGQKTLPLLSDGHIAALRHANETARSLGLRVDLTIGSGWPYGGSTVSINDAAGRLRVERITLRGGEEKVRIPNIGEGEQFITAFAVYSKDDGLDPEKSRELAQVDRDSVSLPTAQADANEVMFFISSRTKQQVKRPAVGGEGYVLNHYDRAAVEAYLKNVGDRLLQAFGDKPPYAVFCDSFECYLSDWTPDLLAEFQKRRGYDLKPLLPALVTEFGPRTEAVRHDWGKTLTELLEERFVKPCQEWAARNHTRFRIQGYGIPPAALSTNRFADLPEGEGCRWKTLSTSRWASSASHLYDRPVTSSETWTWLHSPSFRATPLDLKAEADLHFLQGINQLIGHGWPYSSPAAEYPGWRLYAAGAFNENNPWWIVMPDLTQYLQRVSFLMRQGRAVNDVAIYLPTSDAWAECKNRHVELVALLRERVGEDLIPAILEAGHNFDFIDDVALSEMGKVEKGVLRIGAGRYKAVILPNVERMPAETLAVLEKFSQQGGALLAARRLPSVVPGAQATDADQVKMRDTVQRLFENTGAVARLIANGKNDPGKALLQAFRPDVEFSDGRGDLGFVHRQLPDADIYFIANTGSKRREVRATFRVSGKPSESWDPFSGAIAPISAVEGTAEGSTLLISLEPYEARVIVFAGDGKPAIRSKSVESASEQVLLDLTEGWRVTFPKGSVVEMDHLRSWSEDEATRFFSGVATYEKQFQAPPELSTPGASVVLDFGTAKSLPEENRTNGMRAWLEPPVREAAVVFLNGERVGSLWRPPYQLDFTGEIRPGDNQLRVLVGNTAINHLSGHPLPDYRTLNKHYGERFKPQDMDNLQPLPSGLIGPVRLLRLPTRP